MVDEPALAAIRARCEEEGDCWLWRGAVSRAGYPIYKPAGCGCTLVRRSAFLLAGGVLKPRQPVVTTCEDRLCVNPAHLRASSVAKVARKAAASGAYSGVARCAKIAAAKRQGGKLTVELAALIRVSTESGPVLAARHGVNRSVINGIKAGRMWKDYGNNPFAGLLR